MPRASIPVDLFNPGQVFACLGFMEVAEVLLGQTECRFGWCDKTATTFTLRAETGCNPFSAVLDFLSGAKIEVVNQSPTFPSPKSDDKMTLPILLTGQFDRVHKEINLTHWADGSLRNTFKLYSGNRSAENIACAMLNGTKKNLGFKGLLDSRREDIKRDPFGVTTPIGGSFNFDPRGAWTALDAGFSPNDQKYSVTASPLVELLAAVGLEHARPYEYDVRRVKYAIWNAFLPPMLARPLFGCSKISIPTRIFDFTLNLSGKDKVTTCAQEVTK